ncbi:MAG: triose-phosphate isomerase [Acidobacteria bacterium]|nr:triose-phosphate isomerase [Acidobacteriota bacterium]
MPKLPFICANWKMYKTVGEAVQYVAAFRGLVRDLDGVEIVLAPAFTALHAAAEAARGSNIGIAAQDLHWEREGAYTGEVSGAMAREAGASYAIIGHSERRTLFADTDATVNRKIAAAFAAGLGPIACIGETLDQRERQETFDVLDRQIKLGFDGLTGDQIGRMVIAYEPVWAIGTGQNATPAQAAAAHGHIRRRLRQWFGEEAAGRCRIIYGGSVKPDNIRDLASQPDVDGALVGGASLDVRSFLEIVKAAAGGGAAI